jgi:hypothetical protein
LSRQGKLPDKIKRREQYKIWHGDSQYYPKSTIYLRI